MPDGGNTLANVPDVPEDAYTQLQRAYEQLKERTEMAERLYQTAAEELDRRKAVAPTSSGREERMPNIAPPKPFTGKMTKTRSFTQACLMYLTM
jgi:hypothetical protein